MAAKKFKLSNQCKDGATEGGLFKGISIFVNGYTGEYCYCLLLRSLFKLLLFKVMRFHTLPIIRDGTKYRYW